MSQSPSRRRGGQPGNTNRLIHGRYSRRLSRERTSRADSRTGHDPDFEIAMTRVHLVRLLQAQQKAPAHQWLSYERAVIDCIGLIVSLISAGNRRRQEQPRFEPILESLRRNSEYPEIAFYDSNLSRTDSPDADAFP